MAGIYVQQAKGVGSRWGVALIGAGVAYFCLLGLLEVAGWANGGRVGRGIEAFFVGTGSKPGLIPRPAAFALLAAGTIGAILLAIDRSLPTVLSQLGRGARVVGETLVPATDPNAPETAPAGPRPPPARRPGRRPCRSRDRGPRGTAGPTRDRAAGRRAPSR